MIFRGAPAALRAVGALAGLAATGAALWWCRPALTLEAQPDAAVVRAAAWVGWALVAYLTAGSAALLATEIRGRNGRWARVLAASMPGIVKRAVAMTVGTSVVLGGVGAVAASADDGGSASARRAIATLDWGSDARDPQRMVTVHTGDTLWTIAARSLASSASDAAVAATWPRWWTANRSVIGPNPDLLRPGQLLHPPAAPAGGTHGHHDH